MRLQSFMFCRSRPLSTNFLSLKPGGSPKPLDIHAVRRTTYEVIETGTYRDFAGELRFRITPQGTIWGELRLHLHRN